jgi:hypothetical protein
MTVSALAETAFKPTVEQDTARPGQDFHHFTPSEPSASLCQMACLADVQCRAWEYDATRPNESICWLKNKVPAPQKAIGHIAGVVRPEGPTDAGPPVIVQLAIRSSVPNVVRCVDVQGGRFTQGARLWLYDCNTTVSQLFSYDLASRHLMISNLCVQADGTGKQGAALVLGACSGDANRSWKVEFKQDHAQLIGASGLCLDVPGGRFDNGVPLQVWACNGMISQLWNFTRVKAP